MTYGKNEDKEERYWEGEENHVVNVVNEIFKEVKPPYFDPIKYIWMQYTGLKDKNGKEIYEGDILRDNDMRFKSKWEIKWKTIYSDEGYPIAVGWETYDNVIVIGNIYENPELL